jgi:hypothetical protein
MTSRDDTAPDPPELPGGQDEPPDLDHLLKVVARELGELAQQNVELDQDRRDRLRALWAVIQRFRGEPNGG